MVLATQHHVVASGKVFANPQLLERILVQLVDKNVRYTSISDIKDLATLQRINRSFAGTMSSSNELRCRMGFESRRRKLNKTTPVPHIAVTALGRNEISFPPFKFCVRSSYLYTRLAKHPKTLWLFFHVPADAFAEEYVGTLGYRAGLRIDGEKVHRGKQQSWRQLRLAAREMPVAVVVAVFRPRAEMAKDPTQEPYCLEWIRFRAGEGMLGELADFFDEIGWKERSDHEMCVSRFNGEFWTDLRYAEPAPWRWPSWRHLIALLLGCLRIYLSFMGAKWTTVCIWDCMKRHPSALLIATLLLGKLVDFGRAVRPRVTEQRRKRKEDQEEIKRSKIFN